MNWCRDLTAIFVISANVCRDFLPFLPWFSIVPSSYVTVLGLTKPIWLLISLWRLDCDDLTTWRLKRVTSRPRHELTGRHSICPWFHHTSHDTTFDTLWFFGIQQTTSAVILNYSTSDAYRLPFAYDLYSTCTLHPRKVHKFKLLPTILVLFMPRPPCHAS